MSCKRFQKHIIAYLDGELHQELVSELNEHLKNCKSCNKAMANLSTAYGLIESEKSEFKADPFMSARVLAKINAKELHFSTIGVSLRYLTITSLAAAGIAFGILIGTLYSTNSSIETSSTTQAWDQLANEYMPEVENNPYNLITTTNETPTQP